jgi:hypothetical protein
MLFHQLNEIVLIQQLMILLNPLLSLTPQVGFNTVLYLQVPRRDCLVVLLQFLFENEEVLTLYLLVDGFHFAHGQK